MNEPNARVYSADRHRQGPARLTFDDLLDIVNPVHHLPVVGTAYREVTGDGITGHARILGGTLYGGPLGMASAAANVVVEDATGRDVVGNAFVALNGDSPPRNTIVAHVAPDGPVTANAAASSASAQNADRPRVVLRQPSAEHGPFMQAYLAGQDGSGTAAATVATGPAVDRSGAPVAEGAPSATELDLAPRPSARPPAAPAGTVSPSQIADNPAAPHIGAALAINNRLDAALTALAAASEDGDRPVSGDGAAWREREEAALRALERRGASLDVPPASSPLATGHPATGHPANGHRAYVSAGSLSLGPAVGAGT